MRDVLVAAVIFGSIPFIFRRPYIGVLVYVWVSVMNPHRLAWGFAYDFGFAAVVGAVTLFSAVLSKDLKRPPVTALTVTLLLFIVWIGVTTAFAFYPADAYERWASLMKTQVIVCLIPMLFHRREQLRQLIWVIVVSIAYYGGKGGLWILLTGGAQRVWGPAGSYIEDNNSLAVAIVMIIPLMRYLQVTSPFRYVRWGLTTMMLLCGVAVLGSYSRGALLASAAMVTFLLWKSRHKFSMLIVAFLTIPMALSFMPENWYQRMDTIATYEEDSSARMRLNAWGTMFNIAKDRPLIGGGFEASTKETFERYSPDPLFPPQTAHSIYFQAMGEHGFVGLALFLLLLIAFWRQAGALVRHTDRRLKLAWAHDLSLMMQVSIVGFAVGGAFLSLIYYDVPYYLIGAMVAMKIIVDAELEPLTTPMQVPTRERLAAMPRDHSPTLDGR